MEALKSLAGIIIFFWVLGFLFKLGGKLIHTLLVIGIIVFLISIVLG